MIDNGKDWEGIFRGIFQQDII